MAFQSGAYLAFLLNTGLQCWLGWSILAQADAIPIGQLITGGGSLGINAVIVFWFVNHLNAVRESNEKRVVEIVTAHKDELKVRDDQHNTVLAKLVAEGREADKEVAILLREVWHTMKGVQQSMNIQPPK